MRITLQLSIDDVVYGVGGAFHERSGRVTKVNPSKPAIEDGRGRCSCYWKENLKKIGTVASRFGHCSLCEKPSEFGKPCSHGGPGGRRCTGIILGDLDWRLKSREYSGAELPRVSIEPSMGLFLAKQLGAALFRLGLSGVSDALLEAVREGFRESAEDSLQAGSSIRTVSPGPSISDVAANGA
jgi:hypothetical protein